jgi:hypothetical protein
MALRQMDVPKVYGEDEQLAFGYDSGDVAITSGASNIYVDEVRHDPRDHADSDGVHDLSFWNGGSHVMSIYVQPCVARRVVVETLRHGGTAIEA